MGINSKCILKGSQDQQATSGAFFRLRLRAMHAMWRQLQLPRMWLSYARIFITLIICDFTFRVAAWEEIASADAVISEHHFPVCGHDKVK